MVVLRGRIGADWVMCGLAGYFDFQTREKRHNGGDILARQIEVCRYRGPDDLLGHVGAGFGLAHARLGIIDPTENGRQPFFTNDGRYAIVFNGEIYNFQSLRGELQAKGYLFQTQSDTETLLLGYCHWGIEVLRRLRGMFAFALYDGEQDQLVLARDPLGKKPLYFARTEKGVLFGSEIKSILVEGTVSREADLSALHAYLTYQYVPQEMCAFKGVEKLRPGFVMQIARDGIFKTQKYFSWSEEPLQISDQDAQAEVKKLFQQAVRRRLVADVPVGAFLSGGIDSAAVVSEMAHQSSSPVKTYTIGFEDKTHDERENARLVAQKFATEHHEHIVTPKALDVLDTLTYGYNEPFADSSAIPTYYVSKIASQQLRVVLAGDGGDEAFVGYRRYAFMRYLKTLDYSPAAVTSLLQKSIALLPPSLRGRSPLRQIHRACEMKARPAHFRYEPMIAYLSDDFKRALYAENMQQHLMQSSLQKLAPYFARYSMVEASVRADIDSYLPDDLLIKVDVASMLNSLEVRAPFLDVDLMSFMQRLPFKQRFPRNELKGFLKRLFRGVVPDQILDGQKRGFAVPLARWLREDLKDYTEDHLLSSSSMARGLFKRDIIEKILKEHSAGANHSSALWALLMLERWYQIWIDADNPYQFFPKDFSGQARFQLIDAPQQRVAS